VEDAVAAGARVTMICTSEGVNCEVDAGTCVMRHLGYVIGVVVVSEDEDEDDDEAVDDRVEAVDVEEAAGAEAERAG